MGYLANFMVYTFAMVGIIVIALLIFKNATSGNSFGNGKSKSLKVLDTLSLGPRKTLYVVSTGSEKFLIAGDVDKTSLISKLETNTEVSFKKTMTAVKESEPQIKTNYMDKSNIGIKSSMLHAGSQKPVMKSLVERMR